MRRGTALEIAERAFREGKQLRGPLRDEIIGTQMVDPLLTRVKITFPGWTADEKMAFYANGTVPERYRT